MSTLEHIKESTSTSSDNYSMVVLEFEESVKLDTIGVDIQQSISALSAAWDDMVGTPYVLKINPSMLPVMVAAVSMEGMDTVDLTQFLSDTLINKLEGISGVAQISTEGMVEQQLHVVLDQQKLDSKKCLMIGNDRETDIAGAKVAGIDTFYMHTDLTPADQSPADPKNPMEFEGDDWEKLIEILCKL